MKVRNVMSADPCTCTPDTDLAAVAKIMWDHDCGIVPVVNPVGAVVGLITDRDICMAVATKHRTAAHIAAREAMSENVHACFPEDDVHTAIATMKKDQIRRLPVIDADGHLRGIVSMNDLVLHASSGKGAISNLDIVSTLKTICEHRRAAQSA